ncbi:RNA polymerase, sigma 28 subunit, FliA/WhiG subfamily protein [Nostoc commune NIES-4072]|uniref:RNA polymerase, sigma 28 subunit, FliA/WhiG subfamily protein n=1 Tax=Nostoc commune NIES-4072 TaxID=2005467 RepID=A0A2R5FN62_NOSCO|nr:sigma-70 family RNA polymerase sigma factor [Nostoc commune]BBD69520.1 RNA polymerase, sigma 28 subunit, FliA/WhiG subfamily protein [Nostoc commune HK-02]GBG19479.1 RNA polymerase, sigma 28 subunit, FliA/WhiG subfamily protein [Nostoc commune NIES-4072]
MRSSDVRERNSLAQKNEKLVHKVVHRMSQTCREPYDDLYQLGYIGLLKAADRFDPNTGNAFSSFAIPYIQGEIQHFLRDQWQSVKLPRTALETKAKVRRVQRSLASLGRETDALQIALGLGISEEKWREIEALDSNITISLDELLHEPMQELEDEVDDKAVLKHLNKLQASQRTAIVEKFFSNNSIQDIAKRQKKTPEKIKAYINLGLVKLRVSLSQEEL